MLLLERQVRKSLFWFNDYLNGGQLWKDLKEVSHIISNPEETIDIRRKHLSDILEFATKNTPFYNGYQGCKSLQDFPVVNKAFYREHYKEIEVSIESIPGQKGLLHIQKTS